MIQETRTITFAEDTRQPAYGGYKLNSTIRTSGHHETVTKP